jgi:hypothetical protein
VNRVYQARPSRTHRSVNVCWSPALSVQIVFPIAKSRPSFRQQPARLNFQTLRLMLTLAFLDAVSSPRFSERRPMCFFKTVRFVVLSGFISLAAGMILCEWEQCTAQADDPQSDPEKNEAQARKERYTKWMQAYAEETTVKLYGDAKGE